MSKHEEEEEKEEEEAEWRVSMHRETLLVMPIACSCGAFSFFLTRVNNKLREPGKVERFLRVFNLYKIMVLHSIEVV